MFWKVAGVLAAVQVVTVFLAVVLSAWFAYDQSLNLVESSLRVQLSAVAEEIEQRADLTQGVEQFPRLLRLDLQTRLPDPMVIVDTLGQAVQAIKPDPTAFATPLAAPPDDLAVPSGIAERLTTNTVALQLREEESTATWAVVPLYDQDGLLAGGFVVQPLTNMIDAELAGTEQAFQQAFLIVALLSGGLALLLGGFLTWRLVQPLRRITERVEAIGAGDYKARIALETRDEIGRLAASVNTMAEQVETSIDSLRATDQLRRELLANMGHDLRTPLSALLGYLEEAKRLSAQQQHAEAQQALTIAERQGKHLKRLLSDLFELSVLDNRQQPLRREPVPLGELLHDAARAHRSVMEKAGLTFACTLATDLPLIEADGVRLLRVLDNLLTNARQHTPEGGTIVLEATADANHVQIRVRDTGVGLAEDEAVHVFERYYRGTSARTRSGEGTGLGLPISRAIARAHGGELTVTSTQGEGSTFTLDLPLSGVPKTQKPSATGG